MGQKSSAPGISVIVDDKLKSQNQIAAIIMTSSALANDVCVAYAITTLQKSLQ
jgi:hypothetical protein